MKKVSKILNTEYYMKDNDVLRDKILNFSEIKSFISNNNISNEVVKDNFQVFYDFYMLQNQVKSSIYKPLLKYKKGVILLEYLETDEQKKIIENNKWYNKIKTEYIPKSVLLASFYNLSVDNQKSKLAKEIIELCNNYLNTGKSKGIYIYGKTGIGKSYLLGCTYNYLKSKDKAPCIIYFPEFVRKMKSKLTNGEYIDIIDEIRKQEILFIDDIGAENITEFVRDEIIAPIINYRASENLLTFFTSNLSISNLNDLLSNTRNTIDETKSMRILDRIRYLAKPIYLDAKNEREYD